MSRCTTKPTKLLVRPAKTQISLGVPQFDQMIRCPHEETLGPSTQGAHSEDSDQTGQMPSLICVFAGRTSHFVCFVMFELKFVSVFQ